MINHISRAIIATTVVILLAIAPAHAQVRRQPAIRHGCLLSQAVSNRDLPRYRRRRLILVREGFLQTVLGQAIRAVGDMISGSAKLDSQAPRHSGNPPREGPV